MYNYFKRNYYDAIEKIIPEVYLEEDLKLSSTTETDPISLVLSSLAFYAENVQSNPDFRDNIIPVSAVGSFSSIQDASAMIKYFIPGSKLSEISPYDFEVEILQPLGYSLKDYTTSADLSAFVSETLLPKIRLNGHVQDVLYQDLGDSTNNKFAADASGTHEYLGNSLGLFYFLNYNSPNATTKPYKFLEEDLVRALSTGQSLTTYDAIRSLVKTFWYNYDFVESVGHGKLVPDRFLSGTGFITSGTQSLDRLLTAVDIIYKDSSLADQDDYYKDAINEYLTNGSLPSEDHKKGPFARFMRGVSYMMADIDSFNVKLKTAKFIDECPEELLPYLGDLIGWKFYGSNTSSYRRQLRNAAEIYRKKGTKAGLVQAFNTVIPGAQVDMSGSISEMYESYLPNMMYYLLLTESSLLKDLVSWTFDEAIRFTEGEYNSEDRELNARFVVDHILLRAYHQFPDLFYVRGYKFDLSDPDFIFHYRGRDFPMPPWEEEKFYVDCEINDDLVQFFRDELVCLGVDEYYADYFQEYALESTIKGWVPTRNYENGFMFFTTSAVKPPNYERLTKYGNYEDMSYMTLWNGKSSHFDITLSGSSFTKSNILNNINYADEDFFGALAVIRDYSPAKAVPRVHFDLSAVEYANSADYLYPKLKNVPTDLPVSGALAGYAASSINMRQKAWELIGSSTVPGFANIDGTAEEDLTKTHINHFDLPTFRRAQQDYWDNKNLKGCIDVEINALSGGPLALNWTRDDSSPSTSSRKHLRRRGFDKKLDQFEDYNREGDHMPTFYLSLSGRDYYEPYKMTGLYADASQHYEPQFIVLGFNKNYYRFTDVDFLNLEGTVWDKCENIRSDSRFNGIETSATYEVRGPENWDTSAIDAEREHFFVDRSNNSEIKSMFFKYIDKKLEGEAKVILENNPGFYKNSTGYDRVTSLKNDLWTDRNNHSEYYDFSYNTWKPSCRDEWHSFHKLYDHYMRDFNYHNIADNELSSLNSGGPSVISHAYGPIFFNGKIALSGDLDSSNISTSVNDEKELSVSAFGSKVLADRDSHLIPGNYNEERVFGGFSGIELIDRRFTSTDTTLNKFSLFELDDTVNRISEPNFLINKKCLTMKSFERFPRLKFSCGPNSKQGGVASFYGPTVNFLLPEHDFSVEVSSQFLQEFGLKSGNGSVSVWIHTMPEFDSAGKSVFWNYMPDGTWKMFDTSAVHGQGENQVRDDLCFTKHIEQGAVTQDPCYEDEDSPKAVLMSVQEEDMDVFKLSFNTRNRPIACPLNYYQKYQQVHRKNQTYIVEVFPSISSDKDRFFLFTGMSVKDMNLNRSCFVNHYFEMEDYDRSKNLTTEALEFIRPDNTKVPFNTVLQIDSSGYVYEGDTVLTTAYSNSINTWLLYPKLYKNVNAFTRGVFVDKDDIVNYTGDQKYVGVFKQRSEDSFTPSSLVIEGSSLGSYIIKKGESHEEVEPRDTLAFFRYFRSLSYDDQSRDNTLSNHVHDLSGGSRFNYREMPASLTHAADGGTEYADHKRYSELNLIN